MVGIFEIQIRDFGRGSNLVAVVAVSSTAHGGADQTAARHAAVSKLSTRVW